MIDPKIGTPAPVLGAGPPLVPALGGAGPITVVEGTTFCLSSATGDVAPGTPYGLFFRDARVLSRWDEQTRSWVTPAGRVAVYVGNSSADTQLSGSFVVGTK